eukprot:CAMPEP_0171459008 /NCGR_PEP_ID=MMETSP0945-20130129/4461_1 /TAXON_ID=109269 /ORGANISM="Vaucheria litorea, Strain CCMP2940" /LENGTH=39 /DNA_ID= /DNA_START= /DNA_END= /DNA_ORIENTATION=
MAVMVSLCVDQNARDEDDSHDVEDRRCAPGANVPPGVVA